MNKKLIKKIVLVLTIGTALLNAVDAFSNEKEKTQIEEGLIPQMMGQVKQGGFVIKDSTTNNTSLEISSTKLTNGPKVLLVFRFGA